jgi:predicted AlkP superfamily phosphohydrolase/phosphomutase
MPRSLIAIGLDAFSPIVLEAWVKQGKLPVIGSLMAKGTYARQRNYDLYRTENSWLTLLQGCSPEISQEWGHQTYKESEYQAIEQPTYSFHRMPPFYASTDRRVAIFDIPLVGVVSGVDGVQLLGWGSEANQIARQSDPPEAMDRLIERYGRHPLYDIVTTGPDGSERLSYRIPSVYDVEKLRDMRDKLIAAVRTRTKIIAELISAESWECVLCVYGEIHAAGHLLWHSSQVHPLRAAMQDDLKEDMFLQVAQEIDRSLGELLPIIPEDAELMVFSPHGMRPNSLDLNSMLFLPEIVYRWSSGQAAFVGYGDVGPPPPLRTDYRKHWREEVWSMRTEHGETVLDSPYHQSERGDPLDWDPANWYRPLWPSMRAFCLPGYSDGLVRINVAGRDGDDGIEPEDFAAVGDELSALIGELIATRTGEKAAMEIIRVRTEPDEGKHLSPADIIVRWRDDITDDVMDHPQFGRVGPVPYFRAGGHAMKGFVLGVGPSFLSNHRLPDITTEDVTATILDRMGLPKPPHIMGAAIETP